MKIVAPFTRTALALAVVGLSAHALADAEFERKVEQRLAKLEKQQTPKSGSALGEKVQVSGLIEIEATWGEGYDDESYSDLTVATVELGIAAELNDKVDAEIVLLYEEDETELDVDVATLSFENLVGPVDLLVGKQYLPFGRFETALVNDTLVLELAETNKTAALFGLEQDGFTVGAYLFDGSTDRENNVENYGFTASFGQDNFSLGFDYISALTESDAISELVDPLLLESDDGAVSLSGSLSVDVITIVAEYMTAIDDIEFVGNTEFQPEAIQVEVDFATNLGGQEYSFGFALQESDEAVALGLPESRLSLGGSTSVYENVSLAVEFWHDEDYSESDGGTGEKSNNVVVQLAAEF
ncbi:LbtU family siderophore porin [Ketobacter sp.]|uniref:LbtU family siderophore porin n=1 Tax=Ketobacter sp. TaxID=2083498 RepID=UPI000F1616BB|nr:LbtU family siderophore porin [Ketobacter sp.]RLT98028.1 MAG: LbtU family siderophore porin [Ketobacter sp.]